MVRTPPAAAALGAGLLALACGGAPEAPLRKSALLLTLDTTRADAVGAFGGQPETTPHLDALAAEGLAYDEARTTAPLTLPAHASMLTGLYPPRHTVRDNQPWPLPSAAETIAERARDAGLETAAFVASIGLGEAFGLAQGFDVYDAPPRPLDAATTHVGERRASEVVDRAVLWLERRDAARPFLLWVHLFDPHAPYDPPPDFRGGAPYLGEVRAADHEVGRLFDALRARGAWDDLFVVFVADHGEGLGERGEPTHGIFCNPATIRVPLVVRDPGGARRGEHTDEVASVADVAPTLAAALGLAPLHDVDGASLFRATLPPDRGVYFESYSGYLNSGWSPLAGWADRGGAYVHGAVARWMARRSQRAQEVAADDPRFAAHRAGIAAVAARTPLDASDVRRVARELVEGLRALGYAAAGDGAAELPRPLDDTGLPDPYDRLDELRRIDQGVALLNLGRRAEAIAVLDQLARESPRNKVVLQFLAGAWIAEGRHAEALTPLRALVALGAPWAATHYDLAVCLRAVGRVDDAVRELRSALALDPGHVQSRHVLAELLDARGAADEAARLRDGR